MNEKLPFVASLRNTYAVLKAKSLTGQANAQEYRLKLADLLAGLKTAEGIEGADKAEIKSIMIGANELLKALPKDVREEIDNLLKDPAIPPSCPNALKPDFSFLNSQNRKV